MHHNEETHSQVDEQVSLHVDNRSDGQLLVTVLAAAADCSKLISTDILNFLISFYIYFSSCSKEKTLFAYSWSTQICFHGKTWVVDHKRSTQSLLLMRKFYSVFQENAQKKVGRRMCVGSRVGKEDRGVF